MSLERVIPLDLGFQPSPSASGEIIICDDTVVYVIFSAIDTQLSEEGYLEGKGIAVLEFSGCSKMQHGYPNDEGDQEHPLWDKGLSELKISVGEVLHSTWASSVAEQMNTSAKRIWGEDYCHVYNLSPGQECVDNLRHIILCFKETTFECLTDNIKAQIHDLPFDVVTKRVVNLILTT